MLYVSHRLGEIDSLADHLVVLRDGMIRGEQDRPFDWQAALTHMLGAQVVDELERSNELIGDRDTLCLRGVQLFKRSRPFDLDVRAGEVTGVIGLLGSGKTELAQGVFGGRRFLTGSMEFEGEAFAPRTPRDAIGRGVYLVPEDRAAESMLPGWSIAQTVSLPFLESVSSTLVGVLNPGRERVRAKGMIEDFGVVALGDSQEVDSLSRYEQKVIVGRGSGATRACSCWTSPSAASTSARAASSRRRPCDAAASGIGVVVLTSDIDEVLEAAREVAPSSASRRRSSSASRFPARALRSGSSATLLPSGFASSAMRMPTAIEEMKKSGWYYKVWQSFAGPSARAFSGGDGG